MQPAAGQNMQALLGSGQSPPVEQVLTALINNVAQLGDHCVLVLDASGDGVTPLVDPRRVGVDDAHRSREERNPSFHYYPSHHHRLLLVVGSCW